jgi:hypothetical protein
MKAAIIAGCVALPVLSAPAAHATDYTYCCKSGRKFYPINLTIPNEEKGDLEGGVITWRGTKFPNVKLTGDCRYEFIATNSNGVTVKLCTATQGYAELSVRKSDYYGNEAKLECRASLEEIKKLIK